MTNPTPKHQQEARELLPCPFCGGAIITAQEIFDWPNDDDYICSRCGGRAPKYQWNTRALSSRDTETRQVLEGLRTGDKCWCEPQRVGPHSPACLAARVVWGRVSGTPPATRA